MAVSPSVDTLTARNSAKVYLVINGARIGRVQQISESIANNVQVLNELGSQFAVELKKGITQYRFSIARFYCRQDAFEDIKLGQVFSLEIHDASNVSNFTGDPLTAGAGQEVVLEMFQHCAIDSLTRDYTVGQAVVGENASVVVIGQGQDVSG